MQPQRIPLVDRRGITVAAALVDADDYESLIAFRWYLGTDGYAVRADYVGGGVMRMHRQILGLVRGDPRHTDHINRTPLDNRRANLRILTHAQNMQNRRSNAGSSSKYRSVFWDPPRGNRRGGWRAQVRMNGKAKSLGRFQDEIQAALAAEAYRQQHMPFAEPDPVLARDLAARDRAA